MSSKGYGIKAKMFFSNTSFLLVYKGDVISAEEADRRDEEYAVKNLKCFLFKFVHYKGSRKLNL